MQIFCLFFASFASFFANLAVRSLQGSQRLRKAHTLHKAFSVQSLAFSQESKHLNHINKSTFYIRLTALRRSGCSFFPNASLRYTLGWINVPLRGSYSGQPSVPHSSLEGGKGGCSYRRYDGWTQRFAPTWTALSSTLSFRALSLSFRVSAMNLSSSSRDSSRRSEWQGYMS